MARVLLCTTPWQPFHTLRMLFPEISPHGLQILAAVLRRAGHEVRIADIQHLPPLHPSFVATFDAFAPDVVGFTNNCLPNTPVILHVARELKRRRPGLRLMVGGQVPTSRPAFFVGGEHPVFDAAGQGEGEPLIADLVAALLGQRPLASVPGLALPDGHGGVTLTAPAGGVVDLDAEPLPEWAGTLKPALYGPGLAAPVETARGCPYRCSFCSIPGYFGRAPRRKSVGRILAELRHLKSLGVQEISFIDDSFATDLERARQLFQAMIDEDLGLRFGVQIRADIVAQNPELMALAARAGLILAVVGFEGYTEGVLHEARKGSSRGLNERASRTLRSHGVCVYGTHLFGGPDATWRDNLRTFWRGRFNSDVFRMTIFTPLLGSQLFDDLEREGRIRTHDPREYYYGSYVIEDGSNPRAVQAGYFGLQALHYLLPDTLLKALAHPNPVVRSFNRRAYRGAADFVLGQLRARLTPRAKEAP